MGWNLRIRVRDHLRCFCQPLANFIPRMRSNFRKSQTSELFRIIDPDNFSGELEPLRGIGRNRQANWPWLPNRICGVKSETLLGGVQHDSPALRLELDVREFFRLLSLQTPAFKIQLLREPLDTVHRCASAAAKAWQDFAEAIRITNQ